MDSLTDLLVFLILLAWPVTAITLLVAGFRFVLPLLLPRQRLRAAPWTGLEILLVLFVALFVLPSVLDEVLAATGIYPRAPSLSGVGAGAAAALDLGMERIRRGCWVSVAAFPFQLASVVLFTAWLSRTRPYQLLLTARRAGTNALIGFVGAFIFTPFVYLLLVIVAKLYADLAGGKAEDHPLTLLGKTEPWLIVLPAVVAAPVLEELLFRGLLQQWLLRRRWGGAAALIGALLLALLKLPGKWQEAWAEPGWSALLLALAPALFVLAMVPPYLIVYARTDSATAGAIYGVALLFAAAHSFAWPQPVPLFVLGLGLGYLAYRTQSLVTSIVMHALFNGLACVALLTEYYLQIPG